MTENIVFFNFTYEINKEWIHVGSCLLLAVIYVSSLYVWKSEHDRNHPSVIWRRFLSISAMFFISPTVLYLTLDKDVLEKSSLFDWMGIRKECIFQASLCAIFLCIVFFLGPLSLHYYYCQLFTTESLPWRLEFGQLIWWRNYVVAPLSEEYTFRSCMFPILLQSFQPVKAVMICPLFFGVAHCHHIMENVQNGMSVKLAVAISGFQFLYTTIFGLFSAYLFARTGHLAASFLAHSFCNFMGVPDVTLLNTFNRKEKIVISVLFVVGLILGLILMPICTEPSLFNNRTLWKQ